MLFAHLADAVGKRELKLELPDGATVAAALDRLGQEHEAIVKMRAVIAVAMDEKYVSSDHVLMHDSVLALIPPVSGG